MDIMRLTVGWSGFTGAPGYSNFHFTTDAGFLDGGVFTPDAESAVNTASQRIADSLEELRTVVPGGVTFAISTEATILNSDTGEILGLVPREPLVLTQPTATGGYSAASGAVVNWNTNDYRFGRRIRGRTFLVPLAGGAYEADGTLGTSALSSVRDFAANMVGNAGGPAFGVFSRPRDGAGGVFATATGYSVPDMAAVLRSRRD